MNNEKTPDITVLVVEDDQLLNKTIQKLLQREGFTSEGFLSGSKVLERIFESSNDVLLLLDYSLPDLTAKEIVEKVRARGLEIPFVIVTGHGDEQLAVEMMKLGALDYIVKSLQFHEVVPSKVRRACEEIAVKRKLAQAEEKNKKLEDQLRQSQKLEAIGQLAGGVAHDFNNLLGGIMGNAELIQIHAGKDQELGKYVRKIIQSANKAADLTHQLLTFARKARVNFLPTDVHDRISNVIELLAHTIDKRIVMATDFGAPHSKINGDSNMLENALLNIAINARDAMAEGGTITFVTANASLTAETMPAGVKDLASGEYVLVSIKDTGTGIDKSTVQRIFEPFFTTKELGKGTGLGLASVYGCICQHNGQITVESEIGSGTMFTLFLPVCPVAQSKESSADPVCIHGKGNILVIDDDEIIGDTAVEILKGLGYSPVFFKDAPEALEYFRTNNGSISAVVLDIIMPKINGLDVYKKMKELNPGVKVIIASGYSDNNQERQIMSEGAMEFVQKPYRAYELSSALARTVGKTC